MELVDPVTIATPFFILFVLAEIVLWRFTGKVRYEARDALASLTMGLGSVVAGALVASFFAAIYAFVYQYRLFDIGFAWWAFPLAFVLDDFAYYWFHRWSHEIRWFWAAHVVHHSSQHYNLSTALRQTWTTPLTGLFLLSVPIVWLGVHPAIAAFVSGINLIYQFWIHTEAIKRLPRPVEAVFNTPSHHRVHHATNPRYLDANYAGTFIVWDRMFGTFVPENDAEPCRYGIVKNLSTFNPLVIAFHEWIGIFRDWTKARSVRDWFGYTFGPPGWSHDNSRKTSAMLKADWEKAHGSKVGTNDAGPEPVRPPTVAAE